MSREVLLVPHNHFDPTWRRCFDKPAVYNGVTVRSYAEVEDEVLSAWLEMAQDGCTFTEGQTVVWRKFLERHPDRGSELRRLAEVGQLCCVLAGETVQDTNLPTAEGLVRNFLAAMPLYQDLVGLDHPGLKMAWLEDAFGNSPNYPQVLRGVGAEVACEASYRNCPEEVWVGIDGTKILCFDHIPSHGRIESVEKHPPCPACKGAGCADCGGLGMLLVNTFDLVGARRTLESALDAECDVAVVRMGGEEIVPDSRILTLVDDLNATHTGSSCIKFATIADVFAAHKARLEAAASKRDETPTVDLNPAMPGTYVSRIACKQRTRAAAYKLVSVEGKLATEAWFAGRPVSPPPDLGEAWRHVAFNQFHDAITGTHIDCANAELHGMLDRADEIADRYIPAAPALPQEQFHQISGGSRTVRLGELDVTVDSAGIASVLCGGRDVFGALPYTRMRRDFRIAELVLESDYGDAWGQRIPSFVFNGTNFGQVQLGDFHDRVEVADGAIRWHGAYTGGDPHVTKLEWTVTVRPSADGRRLDFATEVDWDTHSKRLRVVVPVASQEDTATWEVPFGHIERRYDPALLDHSQWHANTLEFPALHWVRREVDSTSGVAVLNRGLPCYRWMPGRMDISLLRSPEWEFCAVEPYNYEFWDIDGQRDTGRHVLQYSIWPYTAGLSTGELTRSGYAYNSAELDPPFVVRGDVVITAWKPAEDGDGWILRVQEAGGIGTELRLGFDSPRGITVTDLLERPVGEACVTDEFAAALAKHQILTVRIR